MKGDNVGTAKDFIEIRVTACIAFQFRIILPSPVMDRFIVIADMMADLQQKRDCKLAHSFRSIGGNIAEGDPLFLCGFIIHYIVSGCQHPYVLYVWAGIHGRPGNRRLVGDYDLCITDSAYDFHLVGDRSSVIYRQFSQLLHLFPA